MTMDRRTVLKGVLVAAAATVAAPLSPLPARANPKEERMKTWKFFLDTHDKAHKTFPERITPQEFEGFYGKYEKACQAEGVVPVRLHVGYDAGRAFCLTMAPDAEAVKRAHDRVGLPYDAITEVLLAGPGDAFFRPQG